VLILDESKKSTKLQFFLVFTVIMCYDSADIGTIRISEEWQGRGFSHCLVVVLSQLMKGTE
jgi:hypothetical protein